MPIKQWSIDDFLYEDDPGYDESMEELNKKTSESTSKQVDETLSLERPVDEFVFEDDPDYDPEKYAIKPADMSGLTNYAEGLVGKAAHAFGRVAEQTGQSVVATAIAARKLPSVAALRIMQVTDPDRYRDIVSSPEKLEEYQESWSEKTAGLAISPGREKDYRHWIDESQKIAENFYAPSKGTIEAESKGGWEWAKSLDWWTDRPVEAIAQLGSIVATNVLVPGSGLVAAGVQGGGQQFLQAEERLKAAGADAPAATSTAIGEGIIMGILEGLLEKVPLKYITKNRAVKNTVIDSAIGLVAKNTPRFVGAGASEAFEEASSELAGMVMQRVYENDKEAFEGAGPRVVQAALLGALPGAALGVPGTMVDVSRGRRMGELQGARPEIQKTRLKQMSDEADSMTLGIMGTEEGKKKLETLSSSPNPTRKDFKDAGYDTRKLRFNEEERANYTQRIAQLLQSDPTAQVAAQVPAQVAGEGPAETPTPTVDVKNIPPDYIPKTEDEARQLASSQLIDEAVDEVLNITGGEGIGNEKKMFGPKGFMARGFKAAKAKIGGVVSNALKPSAKSLIKKERKAKDKAEFDPFGPGSEFDENMDEAGSARIAEAAAKDVKKFMDQEGGSRFAEYYDQQIAEEEAAVQQRFPELSSDTPGGKKRSQFFRGVLKALASARTELSKNTVETILAWEGIRSTGRVPVVFETEVDPLTGEEKRVPAYALPKPPGSKFEGVLQSEVDSIIKTSQDLVKTIPSEEMDILLKKAPVPDGLVKLSGDNKGKPVNIYKDYLYEYFAPKYIPSKALGTSFTTSKPLVAKMLKEIASTSPEEFQSKVRSAFEIGGGSSQFNKADNYDVVNDLLGRPEFQRTAEDGRQEPDFGKIVDWLNERVPIQEIVDEKKRLGYSEMSKSVKDEIIDTVWVAEGQQDLIPRTFMFGPKVGAYMLNSMSDAHPLNANYNTMDVWESRFWRYYNNDVPDVAPGIASGLPRKVYMRQAKQFAAAWKRLYGSDIKVSAGQAARWYLMKQAAKKAGYGKAGENETIPFWTIKALENYLETQLGQQSAGDIGEQFAAAFMGEDYSPLQPEVRTPELPEKARKILTKQEEEKEKIKKGGRQLGLFEPRPKKVTPTAETKEEIAGAIAPPEAGGEVRTVSPVAPEEAGAIVESFREAPGKEVGTTVGAKPGVPEKYVQSNGKVRLFRYSRGDRGQTYSIDPAKAVPQGHSRRDYNASAVKRTFFYLDTSHKEDIVGQNLYVAEADSDKIYDLQSDPNGLKEKHKWGVSTDLQEIMNVLKGEGWSGIFYKTGGMDIVNMFVPVEGRTSTSSMWESAKDNGGFTINAATGGIPTKGFSVSPDKATEERLDPKTIGDKNMPKAIEDYISKWSKALKKPQMHIGGWMDNGVLVMDVPQVVDTQKEATKIGVAADQDAIYDIKNGKVINIREKPSDDTSRQEPHGKPEDIEARRRPGEKAGGAQEAAQEEKANKEAGAGAAPTTTVSRAETAAEAAGKEPGGKGDTDKGVEVAPVSSTLSDYETPETLAERESYRQRGRIDWKPNTGPKGQRTGKAKPLRETVRDMLARVGISAANFYEHTRGPNVVGFYRWVMTRNNIFKTTGRELWIKASELASVGTAVHEVAHFLDQKYNLSGKSFQLARAIGVQPATMLNGLMTRLPPTVQDAFCRLDYFFAQKGTLRPDQVSGLAEGFAEAIRLYCESADPSSTLPIDVKSFIDSLVFDNPEIADLLNATRGEYQAYLNAPDAEKVSLALQDSTRPVISPSESYFARQDRTGKTRGWARLFINKMQNRLRDLEEYERQLKKAFMEHFEQGGADAKKAWDQLLRDTGGLISQHLLGAQNRIAFHTDQAVRHGIMDPADLSVVGPAGRAAFDSFNGPEEMEDFGRYMYAKVAMLRRTQAQMEGREYVVGETDPAVLRRFIDYIENGPNAQKFAAASKEVTDYFNNLLALEVKHGLKTQGEADAMMSKHDIYMPFFRQMGTGKTGSGGKILGVVSSIRKLKSGSVMPVLDVYEAMIDRTNDVMSEVVRKSCETNFLRQAELSGVSGNWVRKLTAEEASKTDNVTKITTDGTTYYYQIDKDLKRALTQVGPQLAPVMADVLSVIGSPNALARKLMVTWNIPYFTPKNYIRDLKTASIRGLQDITGIESTVKAANPFTGSFKTNTDVSTLFDQMGLAHTTRVRTSRGQQRKVVFSRISHKQQKRRVFLGKKGRKKYQAMLDWVAWSVEKTEAFNDLVELAPRREAFLRTLQLLGNTQGAGFSVDNKGKVTGKVPMWALSRAAYNAMEVTTNFNRRGEWQPYIEPIFLFYNAAIQGTAGQLMTVGRAMEDITGPQAKRLAIAAALGATAKLAALAIMYYDRDEDDESSLEKWAELADYYRDGSDVWVYKGYAIQIPREREWGWFHRVIDETVAGMVNKGTANPWAGINGFKGIKNQVSKEFWQRVPVTGGTTSTALQLFFNYDLFRNEEIEKSWEKGRLPQYRYDERTGWIAKAVAPVGGNELFEFSPRQVDFVARNITGQMFGKLAGFAAGGEKLSDIPIMGPFWLDLVPRQSIADYRALKERSAMEFDEWANDRAAVPEEAVARILDNEGAFGAADGIMKLIWNSDEMDNATKQKYVTGLARWVLDRKTMDEYPNPLTEYKSADIPKSVRADIVKVLRRELTEKVRPSDKMPAGSEKLKQAARARIGLRKKIVKKEE